MASEFCLYCMKAMEGPAEVCPHCGITQGAEVPPHHLRPGTVIAEKYLVGYAIGEGGFGITYIGRDLNLDLRVAIKEYYPNGFANRNHDVDDTVTITGQNPDNYYAKGKSRFLQEARVLAKFSQERGVVGVRDFFEKNNTAYIIMEYLEGTTLKQYLDQKGPVEPGAMTEWIVPLLRVLGKIHDQGLIHRDISPDNIMVTTDGHLKLIDFGAAREVTSQKSLSVVLKPGYAPGEQYYTKGNQGPWTDIYAICATIYKCITGVTPEESSQRVFEDHLKPPSALGIDLPVCMEAALMKGMSLRYADRQQTTGQLITELLGEVQEAPAVYLSTAEPAPPVPAGVAAAPQISAGKSAPASPAPGSAGPRSGPGGAPPAPPPSGGRQARQPKPAGPSGGPSASGTAPGEKAVHKRRGIIFAAVAAVAVIALVVLLAGILGGEEDVPLPKSMEVLSQITADGSVKGTVQSFQVEDSHLNKAGTTYTVNCSVDAGEGPVTVRVIYELEDGEWECTQVIVLD